MHGAAGIGVCFGWRRRTPSPPSPPGDRVESDGARRPVTRDALPTRPGRTRMYHPDHTSRRGGEDPGARCHDLGPWRCRLRSSTVDPVHTARPRTAAPTAFTRIATVATVLAFGVVVLGAYVRLTDAGLGCPDWPGCYGRPVPGAEAADAGKAWREMIHRYAAGTLGLLVAALAAMAWRRRRSSDQPRLVPALLLGVIIFQSLLGMWTVTLLLEPVIVMGHLLGGLTTLGLLTWLALGPRSPADGPRQPGALAATAVAVLIAQMALGGWTSANYAATACPDVPACRSAFWPDADFAGGFVARPDVPAARLPLEAKTAIHLAHRVGAALTVVMLGSLALALSRGGRSGRQRWAGAFLATALAMQATLGISLVAAGFPLSLGVAHNAGAALLLVASVAAAHSLGTQNPGKSRRRSSRSTGPRTSTSAEVVEGSSRP